METREVIYSGYLRKSPPEKRMETDKWRIRYFKLWNDKLLEYYKNDIEKKYLKRPIDLNQCNEVCDAKEDQSKHYKHEFKWPFCLQMPGRLYYLLAKSEEECKLWKEKICELCSFGTLYRNPEYMISVLVNNSKYSPNSSSNSSHNGEEQRSGSDSSGTQLTFPISIPNASERTSTISDVTSMESDYSYDELPPPRVANINLSKSFGTNDNNNLSGIYKSPTLSTSYNASSYDSISTNRSSTMDTKSPNRSLTRINSDVFSPSYVYDVPPSNRKKQLSTKSSTTNELGYVKMDPSAVTECDNPSEDYIEMQGEQYIDMQSEEYIQMHGEEYLRMGASSPNELMGRGSVKEFKPIGSALNRLPSVNKLQTRSCGQYKNVQPLSPKFSTFGMLAPSFEEDVFDEIPEIIGNKHLQETGLEPPAVDRKAKPCPTIDRTTKPKVGPPEESYVNSSEISSSVSGYISFSHHGSDASDDYQNTPTNNSLTSNNYYNDQIIHDQNNNTKYNEKQKIGPTSSNENQHNKPGPYSSHKCNDGAFDRTDHPNEIFYRDTNNNHVKDIVLPPAEDEYLHKDLPSLPVSNELENQFEEMF